MPAIARRVRASVILRAFSSRLGIAGRPHLGSTFDLGPSVPVGPAQGCLAVVANNTGYRCLDARIFPLSVRYIIGKLASDSGPHDGWIAVKLTASRSHIASVDFRGRIAFGRLAVETGQFHLDRRFVRVAVLTVRLRGAVG